MEYCKSNIFKHPDYILVYLLLVDFFKDEYLQPFEDDLQKKPPMADSGAE